MDPNSIDPHLAYLMPVFFGIGLVFLAIVVIPLWQICKKAGFSPWLCLLILIPFGGLILLYVLAFAQWKVVPAPQLAGGAYPSGPYPPAYPPNYPPAPPSANPNDPALPR